ncbi:MAG: M61 family metallopeptidase [Bdellovibrio bacteriovorus]
MAARNDGRFDLTYRVIPANPEAHLFEVELHIGSPPPDPLILSLPAWIPGSYMIRDFARNLVRLAAADASGRPLTLTKGDKQTWMLEGSAAAASGGIWVRYQVFAWDLSVRAAHLDTNHAFFNGSSLFLRVHGRDDRPCKVELSPPYGATYADWRVATSLVPLGAPPQGFGDFRAEDYLDLIDHPVEMGRFDLVGFEVGGVPHAMAISGRHRADGGRLATDLKRICEQHAALFGELPIDRYLFLTTAVGDGYGGLEHRFSASLICSRDDLPRTGQGAPSEGYRRFLGLCSHEYFHLWHVKRIRPRALMQGGLDSEVHTRLLWAFEGITSYYDELALMRSGVIDTPAYLQLLAETITRVMRTPGRWVQTLAESSFDAWTKFYKPDENAPNAIVSYYAKGALVALALDLIIRRDTQGTRSLDDVLRALWDRHGRPGIGVEERGVERLAAEVTGLDLDAFFAQALDSTEDLDIHGLLATVGVEMRMRPAKGPKDLGGWVEDFEVTGRDSGPGAGQDLSLAVRLKPGSAEAVIQHVLSGGAGERAGLAPGDTVIAVDGLRVTAESLERVVAQGGLSGGEEGMEMRLHLFRRDELLELTARPLPAVADTCELRLCATAPEGVLRARSAWLSGAA